MEKKREDFFEFEENDEDIVEDILEEFNDRLMKL